MKLGQTHYQERFEITKKNQDRDVFNSAFVILI